MTSRKTLHINAALWRAIEKRASALRTSPETWLWRQLDQPGANLSSEPDESISQSDEALYNYAWSHFKGLALTSKQASAFGNAIQQTITSGEPRTISISPNSERRYAFHRRLSAVSMRFGSSRIRLPLEVAARLAKTLNSAEGSTTCKLVAA